MRERIGRYRMAVSDHHPVAEDTVAFMHALATQVPVGIASGAFREEIVHVLELTGLAGLVSVIVSIDEVRDEKPHPESFITALAHINRDRPEAFAPEHTVVIEDATDGARAARAAGMRCVAIRGSAYEEATGLAELVVDRLTVMLARVLLGFEP
ncbi:MAG: HAD-IA family hydrolase [Actinomycetota bacterium]|nr:HAD-IA family hydrolase [Actinomycetota bacterium]